MHQAAVRIADEELSEAISSVYVAPAARSRSTRTRACTRPARRSSAPARSPGSSARAWARASTATTSTLRDAARRLAERRDAAVARRCVHAPGPRARRPPRGDPRAPRRRARRGRRRRRRPRRRPPKTSPVVRSRSADWPPLDRGWSILEPGLKTSYKQGRQAMRTAFADPTPAAFHAWRKRVKDLWYHTQLLHNVWKGVQSAWAEALEDLSDALGDDHDLEVLRAALATHPDLDPDARPRRSSPAPTPAAPSSAPPPGPSASASTPSARAATSPGSTATGRPGATTNAAPPPPPRPTAPDPGGPPSTAALQADPEFICPGDYVSSDMPCRPAKDAPTTGM
ncbi:CHAD domain-containing protein [Nannocystis sp. ncelm1]|uniref:CHAD domain-containing protein n=2 Tax=Nannocystis radixulma TaxID=2995305 RepID=A0ABT5BMS2_9BACT|nr:CHAD domain-containing protein [Nannocystis radixulma]